MKERTQCSPTTRWTTCHLCITNSETEQQYSNIERVAGSSLCTWETKPLHIWIHHNSTVWSWTIDEHMEENHCSSQSDIPEITTETVKIQYRNRIHTGQRKANALSRVYPSPPTQQDYELDIILVHIISNTVPSTATQDSVQNDSTLTKLKHAVHSGWPTYAKAVIHS